MFYAREMWWVGIESTGWTDEGLCEYRKLQPYEKRCLGWNLNECEIAVWKIVLLAIGVANNTHVQLDNRASISCEVGGGLDPFFRLNHWDIPQMRINCVFDGILTLRLLAEQKKLEWFILVSAH